MEKKVIEKSYHEHPLILTETVRETDSSNCYGCGKPVTNLDAAYICTHQHCSNRIILHRRCGELPSEIMHPIHSRDHPLYLFDFHLKRWNWCNLCRHNLGPVLGYKCSSCNFNFCITCEMISIDAILDEKRELQHPCHLDHPLTLMRKHAFTFYCDGCGTRDVDLAYICSICEFWIHKSCASLPLILPTNLQYHHHHHLSLAFSIPTEHLKYIFYCDICDKRLNKTCWVYFCGDCRFFAHLKCVASTTETPKQDSNINKNGNGSCDAIEFPLYAHDMSKELITAFVMREKGVNKIPDIKDCPPTVNIPETTSSFSFLFNYHNHPLSLISEFQEDDKKLIKDDEEIENDHELKVCDMCVTPISSPDPYYECAPCKYFVHSICYLLPKTLSSSHPLHGRCLKTNHRFTLYTSSKSMDMDVEVCRCDLCGFPTNGMVYECEGCEMKIDVKCMSLPATIKHASHLHHTPLILARIQQEEGERLNYCHNCTKVFNNDIGYRCSNSDCDFALDLECALLPSSITNHDWDKHVLPLTFDASRDHPSDFICEICEEEMHPKKWMYHCRQCDYSFHPPCLKNASGDYRNIKFGREFVLDGIHPHPLTFNWATLKRRCDICHSNVYNFCDLECAACNYVVCLHCLRRGLLARKC